MKTHYVKCWSVFFVEVIEGFKSFDVRINDRDYQVGDILCLQEYDPLTSEFSGLYTRRLITYIFDSGMCHGTNHRHIAPDGLKTGFVVLGLGFLPK